MKIKLLTEHHLESLSLKVRCMTSYESTFVKMPHCWKSHVMAHIHFLHLSHHENRSRIWALVELIHVFIYSTLNKEAFYAHLQWQLITKTQEILTCPINFQMSLNSQILGGHVSNKRDEQRYDHEGGYMSCLRSEHLFTLTVHIGKQ